MSKKTIDSEEKDPDEMMPLPDVENSEPAQLVSGFKPNQMGNSYVLGFFMQDPFGTGCLKFYMCSFTCLSLRCHWLSLTCIPVFAN